MLSAPEDPDELAEQIMRIRTDPQLKELLERESRLFFWSDYNPKAKAESLLERLVSGKAGEHDRK